MSDFIIVGPQVISRKGDRPNQERRETEKRKVPVFRQNMAPEARWDRAQDTGHISQAETNLSWFFLGFLSPRHKIQMTSKTSAAIWLLVSFWKRRFWSVGRGGSLFVVVVVVVVVIDTYPISSSSLKYPPFLRTRLSLGFI